MTTAELQAQISAMRDSIQAQQEKLDEMEKELESTDWVDDIDKPLKIEGDDQIYYVNEAGEINSTFGTSTHVPFYNVRHRAFKQFKYAEMYREKTQCIADLLHFKWLYDRDYEPDWSDVNEDKYCVWYDHEENIYRVDSTRICESATVYFSRAEIAKKCVDWLNRKAGII